MLPFQNIRDHVHHQIHIQPQNFGPHPSFHIPIGHARHTAAPYWPCNRLGQIALQPRPYGELQQEREKLLRNLNEEDDRATDMYRQLLSYEDKLQYCHGGDRRDVRRDHHWVRRKIEESIEIQKAIIARLGEVHVEIQSRGRWVTVWEEKAEAGRLICPSWHWGPSALWSTYERQHPQKPRSMACLPPSINPEAVFPGTPWPSSHGSQPSVPLQYPPGPMH